MKLLIIKLLKLYSLFSVINCNRSFLSTGVPCYMHPAGDGCHYRLKPDSDACTTPSERRRLNEGILIVNRTLVSLEKQLIRLGIIPPDNACSELPSIDNGGIIYSDLNLAPGASGRYVCDEGYILITFYERYEFTCTEGGVWNGNVTEVPIACQLASDRCDPPHDVINGTISYINDDPDNILIGDMIKFSCEEGHELHGPLERYCLRNGNWSGSEPLCFAKESETNGGGSNKGRHVNVIGAGVGSASTVLVIGSIAVTILLSFLIYKRRTRHKERKNTIPPPPPPPCLEISEDYNDGWDKDDVAVHVKITSKKKSSKYCSTQQTFNQGDADESSM